MSPLWAAARDDFRTRRAAREARKTLERELASYTTPAEQSELDAMLARADVADDAEIRRIIYRSRVG